MILKYTMRIAAHKAVSVLAAAILVSAAAGINSAAAYDSGSTAQGVIIAPGVNVSAKADNAGSGSGTNVIVAPGVNVPGISNNSTADSTGNAADNSTGSGTASTDSDAGNSSNGSTGAEGAVNNDAANNSDVSQDSTSNESTDSDESSEQNTYNIDPTKPMIALTFDDGPRTSVTSRILDSLKQYGGRATFFMVGSRVNANADVIRRMVEQGCEVGNHTHDHKYISKISNEQIISQVGTTNQLIAAVCGVNPVVMRPPGGYVNANSLSVVGSMGMSAIMWSIDTRDWEHRNSAKTIQNVLNQVKDGDIILMHDIYDATGDAAVALIPELTARGYQLVTVSEMAALRGGMTAGGKYNRFRP